MTHTYKTHTQTHADKIHNTLNYAIQVTVKQYVQSCPKLHTVCNYNIYF